MHFGVNSKNGYLCVPYYMVLHRGIEGSIPSGFAVSKVRRVSGARGNRKFQFPLLVSLDAVSFPYSRKLT